MGTRNRKMDLFSPPHSLPQAAEFLWLRRCSVLLPMLFLLSLASSALLAPGFRGVQLLESTPTFARSPASRMGQTPTEPAGDVANVGKRSALKGWFTSTTLDLATFFGSARLATATIKAGASLESRAKSAYREVANSSTPLQLATVAGEAGVIKALVDAGASLEANGGIGSTPLQLASKEALCGTMQIKHERAWTW
mgnify:CR=1 FL=1